MAVLACDAGTLVLIFVPKLILARNGRGLGEGTMRATATKIRPEPTSQTESQRLQDELAELSQENEQMKTKLAMIGRDEVQRIEPPQTVESVVE